MPVMLTEFDEFLEEKSLIGDMLIAYGEIEFATARLISTVLNQEDWAGVKILFRVRGESARLAVADALIRPYYEAKNLDSKWGNALGAARTCILIRNQYAHCHWWARAGEPLCFLNLDEEAKLLDDATEMKLQIVDQSLLQEQHRYFEYALMWLYYLDAEYRVRAGILSSHEHTEPKSIPAPPRSNRAGPHP